MRVTESKSEDKILLLRMIGVSCKTSFFPHVEKEIDVRIQKKSFYLTKIKLLFKC